MGRSGLTAYMCMVSCTFPMVGSSPGEVNRPCLPTGGSRRWPLRQRHKNPPRGAGPRVFHVFPPFVLRITPRLGLELPPFLRYHRPQASSRRRSAMGRAGHVSTLPTPHGKPHRLDATVRRLADGGGVASTSVRRSTRSRQGNMDRRAVSGESGRAQRSLARSLYLCEEGIVRVANEEVDLPLLQRTVR
jgi:hypothetical protein